MVNEIVQLLNRYGALEFGDFVLASGEKSTYYLDIKKVVTRPEALERIAALISRTHVLTKSSLVSQSAESHWQSPSRLRAVNPLRSFATRRKAMGSTV